MNRFGLIDEVSIQLILLSECCMATSFSLGMNWELLLLFNELGTFALM